MESAPLVVIVGETASGKSQLAMEVAKSYNGEIIAADSRTIYRYMDIGTAKPSQADQQQIPHHMLDVRDPNESYSAARFKRDALMAIKAIGKRGKLPIMVGGTGLYIDAVLFDYGFQPPNQGLRVELDKLTDKELRTRAKAMGINGTDIDFQNRRHLQRAVEAGGVMKQTKEMRANTLVIGLSLSREVLKQRITDRVEAMVQAGFIDEVKAISARFGWDNEALTGIGYQAFKKYLEGDISLDEAKAAFVKGDLQLAKRQRTWFKRNKSIHWINSPSEAWPLVDTFLHKVD